MSMNQKSIILTISLFSLLVATGAFWSMQNRQAVVSQPVVTEPVVEIPVETEPETAIDTSDWQTYRNEEYGFEFKYPGKRFYIKQDSDSSDIVYVTVLKNGRAGIDIDKPGKIGILLNNLLTEKYMFSKMNGHCDNVQINAQVAEMCNDNKSGLDLAMRNYASFIDNGLCTGNFGFSLPVSQSVSKDQNERQHHVYVTCDSNDLEVMEDLAEVMKTMRFTKK